MLNVSAWAARCSNMIAQDDGRGGSKRLLADALQQARTHKVLMVLVEQYRNQVHTVLQRHPGKGDGRFQENGVRTKR